MTQYDFDKLLERYLKGETTLEEDIFLDEWSNRQHPSDSDALSKSEEASLKTKMWKRITLRCFNTEVKLFNYKYIGITIVFLSFLAAVIWYNMRPDIQKPDSYRGIEMKNTTAVAQLITLKDGTTVNLQPNSTLTFSEKFDQQNRIVYLKGEGFFDVKRNASKPFFVYAGNLVTKVLGTSFTVKSYDYEKISEVIVVSGKVIVYKADVKNKGKVISQKAFLTPNKKVVFEKTTNEIKTTLVDKPVVLVPPKSVETFLFKKESVTEVLKKLEKMYGVEIIPVDELKGCDFTGDLNDLDLDAQLYFITNSINGYYEKQETKILIFSKGC
jgi:transmembrane sensor